MKKLGIIFTLCLLLTFLIVGATVAGSAGAGDLPDNLTHQLRELTEGKARISTHAKTGKVRFIGTELSHPIPQPAALKASASPEEAARAFLAEYGSLFGLSNQARELTMMRGKTVDDGRSFVRFQQVYEDVPIVGGELIVQVSPAKNIISANGEVLPDISLDTTPTVEASSAQEAALNVVVKEYGIDPDALRVSKPELWIYNPIILGMNWDMTSLVWRMEVEPVEFLPIRELVLVDANLGVIALHFNQIATAKYRKVYDNQNNPAYGLPGNGPVRSEGGGPHGVTDVNYAYDYTGDTYDFYWNEHGRDSIDGTGMNLISTVRYCDPSESCPYANAYWTSTYQQMVFGHGYASADDVVGHEMTHGVTSYESNLFYYMQSGAINEAFSDIWGEFIDLTNGAGNDTPGVRWLMGEDLPIGAIRDMSNPPAYGLPDKMTSGIYYCSTSDQGGVHTNMGVGCKAAYLMVDGGSFNGYTVAGFGGDTAAIAQAADLWYEVQTNLFTSASDYADLYDCLQQAAINLGFSSADQQTVKDAVDATEMNLQPPSCPATEAPICDSGSPSNLWFDDLENTASGCWTSQPEWYYPQNSHPYTGFDATYATSGQYNIWGYDAPGDGISGAYYYIAMTQDVALPGGSYLHFNHAYSFEYYMGFVWDGGVVEYSTNGGGSWNDTGSLFTHNGYSGTIASGSGNPLQGRQAFASRSNGYISSRLDLSSLAGQNVRFRFRIGTDSSGGDYGWFIDDIRIYTCAGGAGQPDLVVSKSIEFSGGNFTVSYNVTNTGNVTANASTTCKSVNGTLEESQPCPALGPGESYNGTFDPEPCPCGESLNVTVCADNDDVVNESNETNNCEINIVDCPAMPDLVITEKSEEWVDLEAKTYNITYTVTNQGCSAAGASNTTITINGTDVLEDPVPALAAGANSSNTVGPFTMSGNSANITVCADNGDVVAESNETNNCEMNAIGMEGDANLNGCASIVDALLIAQYLAGIRTISADQFQCADTTDEGSVSIVDALHIAQWLVDPDGSFGVLAKPLWQSPADDDMLEPVPC